MEVKPLTSRVQRVRHEARQRDVTVAKVEAISPNFVSVTFTGDSLSDFKSASFDDHVKFMFTDGQGESVRRDYTPRRFDARNRHLTIEFGLHRQGHASTWARQAAVGQTAVIGGPRGSMIIPSDFDWHLLVGDSAALPAIHRRLEELPAGAQAFVFVQISDPADRRSFQVSAQIKAQWFLEADDMISAVRALKLPSDQGFTWCAGEAGTMAQLRQVLLIEKALPCESMRIGSYWKRGDAGFHESLVNPADSLP